MLKKSVVLSGLLLLAGPAFALIPNVYIGGAVGTGALQQKVSVNNTAVYSESHFKMAFNGHVGLMLNQYFGAEFGQAYLADDSSNSAYLLVKSKNNKATYLAGVGAVHLANVSLYAKIGGAYVQSETQETLLGLTGETESKHNAIVPYVAVGMQVNVFDDVGVYFEAAATTRSGNVPGSRTAMLGLNFTFPSI